MYRKNKVKGDEGVDRGVKGGEGEAAHLQRYRRRSIGGRGE